MENRRILWLGIVGVLVVFALTFTVLAIQTSPAVASEETQSATSEVYIPSETESQPTEPPIILEVSEYILVDSENIDELSDLLNECEERKASAQAIKENALKLGYKEDHPIITLANMEVDSASTNCQYYAQRIEEIKKAEEIIFWEEKKNEYPVATTIWLYLKDLEYNDYICAGIIGNMMAEAGGQTLNIQPEIYDGSGYYYGICQWNGGYCAEVHGKDLKGQLDFLAGNIKYEIDTFGYAYQKGFNLNTFLSLENEQDAAVAFAKTYERCASSTYTTRANNATNAYNYFVNS